MHIFIFRERIRAIRASRAKFRASAVGDMKKRESVEGGK